MAVPYLISSVKWGLACVDEWLVKVIRFDYQPPSLQAQHLAVESVLKFRSEKNVTDSVPKAKVILNTKITAFRYWLLKRLPQNQISSSIFDAEHICC